MPKDRDQGRERKRRLNRLPLDVRQGEGGFTLVEMALVLLVTGLVLLIVYPALNVVRVSTQRSLTDSNLQALLRATAVYVQANGCLPCPALPYPPSPEGFGRVRGDTGAAPCGPCANPEGIAPFVSLGIPQTVARDGWGRWITMRVDPALANPPNPRYPADTAKPAIVPPDAPCQCGDFLSGNLPSGCLPSGNAIETGCVTLGAREKGLCKKDLSKASEAIPVAVQTPGGAEQKAAVIFVSHGANGYGALYANPVSDRMKGTRLPFPDRKIPTCANGSESCNASNTERFVNAPHVPGGKGSLPFDDSLVFLDRNNLVSFLGNASCQTVW